MSTDTAVGATASPAARSGSTPIRTTFPLMYRLFLRNQATKGRLALLGGLGLIGLLLGLAIRFGNSDDPISDATHFIDGFGLVLLVPITALVFGSSTFADVTEDKTLVYLWLRPVSRMHVVFAAAAASVTICLPLVAFPLVLSAMVAEGGPALVGGTAIAVLASTVGYVGIFTWLGLRFRRALAGIEAGQGLVQDDDPRVVNYRLCHLHPLLHAAGVGAEAPTLVGVHLDHAESVAGHSFGVLEAVEAGSQHYELERRLGLEGRLLLGHHSDEAVHADIGPGVASHDADLPLGRGREAAQHSQHGGFSGAVGAEESGDAGADRERHVRHGDHIAEPLRDPLGPDHRPFALVRGSFDIG